MAIQQFDQLNSLSKKWYSKMEVPQNAKDRRVKLSMEFTEIVILFFDLIIATEMLREQQIAWLEERLNVVASNHLGVENLAYINDWSKKEAENIVDTTIKHKDDQQEFNIAPNEAGGIDAKPKTFDFEEFDVSIPQREYWTSDIRGLLIGIECASAIENYYELYDALNKGMTNKVWKSEGDDRVRKTHTVADGDDIPVNDLFLVGNSYLLFPGDATHGAEEKELCRCRCHCEYYKK